MAIALPSRTSGHLARDLHERRAKRQTMQALSRRGMVEYSNMASKRVAFILALVVAIVRGDPPAGYIIDVLPNCGADAVADGYVEVVTDLNANAKAVCAGGTVHKFSAVDKVKFRLDVSYPGRGSSPCVFEKRKGVDVYVITVTVAYGQKGGMVQKKSEQYTVTCTFSAAGGVASVKHTIHDGLTAPLEVQHNTGSESKSTVTLNVVDVLGNDLTGSDLHLVKTVQLKAVSKGEQGEKGVKPVSCDAIGVNTKKRYPVLRAGCGDGIIFKRNQGFTTTGLTSVSPYFPAFNVASDPVVSFQCNFTFCDAVCDGSTCKNDKNRRSAEVDNSHSSLLHTIHTGDFLFRVSRTRRSADQHKQGKTLLRRSRLPAKYNKHFTL
ncbi:vitelline envelope sperm lysin receptor-like isoform X2 [Haliotis rubra]|uniref:vitelline envelope sperm lysin receptor-like isoform X2 n=1 Tax=Haliotis rubra TaxID=36100 RepID=UPI001EE617F4|nr:vitelline envelope sperm lysin receptor-like isoform X2 [Haliotis rubra]